MKGSLLWRDFLAALSLANLSFIVLWDGLLNYTPAQAFYLEHAPPAREYAAAFASVMLTGLVFFLLIRVARFVGSRYGIAGIILGTLPILAVIAFPAVKSIARLIQNRSEDVGLTLIAAVLVILLAATALLARRRFFQAASAFLITLSPLILIEGALSISRTSSNQSAAFADGPFAPRIAHAPRPRAVWIIFDELDFRLAFPDRPSTVAMPTFDRLRDSSLFAQYAIPPANDTSISVPSLITGVPIEEEQAQGPRTALWNGVPATARPTIFSTVHARGGNVAVVGWYIPYCRLFAQDLVACSSHDLESELNEAGSSFLDSVGLEQRSLFAYGYRSVLGESPRAQHHLQMMDSIHRDALRDAADPSLDLVFLHLPVPHAPYLYDRATSSFPKRYLGVGSYLDNLALADIYLRDLQDAIITAGLWDTTTLLVSSDHPDRTSLAVDGKQDHRVPFILKLAGQTTGFSYESPFNTVVTKSILEAILNGEIHSTEEAVTWLTPHHR